MAKNSGRALVEAIKDLDWVPDSIYQIGVGGHYSEVEVFRHEWPGVKIIGCEPHPLLFKRLQNKYPGRVYNVAIGDKTEVVGLYHRAKHKDGSSIFQRKYDPNRLLVTHRVKSVPMDSFFGRASGKTLLWLDCEGSEFRVLQGAKNFLKGVSVINVEVCNNPPCDGWCSAQEVGVELVKNGFVFHATHTHRGEDSVDQYDAVYVRDSLC